MADYNYDIQIKQEDGTMADYPIHVDIPPIDAVTSPTDADTVKKVGQVRENNGKLEYALNSAPDTWKEIGGGGGGENITTINIKIQNGLMYTKTYKSYSLPLIPELFDETVKKIRIYGGSAPLSREVFLGEGYKETDWQGKHYYNIGISKFNSNSPYILGLYISNTTDKTDILSVTNGDTFSGGQFLTVDLVS